MQDYYGDLVAKENQDFGTENQKNRSKTKKKKTFRGSPARGCSPRRHSETCFFCFLCFLFFYDRKNNMHIHFSIQLNFLPLIHSYHYINNSSNTEFTVCKIKCETDFVAKNKDFLNFAEDLSKAIHIDNSINNLGTDKDLSDLKIKNKPFSDCITDLISKIGENIQLVSYKKYLSKNSIFITYLHNKYNSNCSKIGSVVEISTDNIDTAVKLVDELKIIAMQISAMKPMGIDESSINSKILEDEKDIILKQINNVPDDKKNKIIEGKLNKFIKENTLLGQALITDPKKNVGSYLNEISKKNNITLNIVSMDLYNIQ